MQVQDLQLLYDYNYWANGRILAVSSKVDQTTFQALTASHAGGLRGTLIHTFDTEYGWRMLCQHGVITPDITAEDLPTLAALVERWHEEQAMMRAYLTSLLDDDLAGLVRYTTGEGETRERVLWHCLLHIVNHGTQHRSEAAALLTEYGQSPGDLDFTMFLNER